MLCKLILSACTPEGTSIAQNFVHLFVSDGYPPSREETPRALILRGSLCGWSDAQWNGEMSDRDKARVEDACFGFGHGFFEWRIPLDGVEISKARRIKVLCEASSHRIDGPQTDADIFPTTLEVSLNGVRVYRGVLRNHPHDGRGVLSYLRGGVGAYGYLVHAFVEDDLFRHISEKIEDGALRLRCAVPADAIPMGGLTIYGAESGRFPVSPTIIIEW